MAFVETMANCLRNNVNNYVFIAVNYNNSEYTRKYITSVLSQEHVGNNIHIVIVDNNSSENDHNELDKMADNGVIIIKNKDNVGYFKALNTGISYTNDNLVRKISGVRNFIIIGNNDIEIGKGFINKLAEIDYTAQTLAIAPNIITKDGYNQNPHCIKRLSPLRKLGYRIYVSNYYLGKSVYWLTQKYKNLKGPRKNPEALNPQSIYMGIGACYILTENFFRFFSQLDDRVFLWGEEALFAGQIASVDGKIWYEPKLVVYHNESTSVSKMPSRQAYDIWKESFKIYSKYL